MARLAQHGAHERRAQQGLEVGKVRVQVLRGAGGERLDEAAPRDGGEPRAARVARERRREEAREVRVGVGEPLDAGEGEAGEGSAVDGGDDAGDVGDEAAEGGAAEARGEVGRVGGLQLGGPLGGEGAARVAPQGVPGRGGEAGEGGGGRGQGGAEGVEGCVAGLEAGGEGGLEAFVV